MKKSIIALLGLAVILGGCSNKVSYGDAQATETTTIDFGQVFHSLSIFFDICQNILLGNIIYSKKMTATKILTHNEDSPQNS